MNKLFVECTHINLETGKIGAQSIRNFTDQKEFNEFYKLAKEDASMVINIMNYDPYSENLKKDIYKVKLLSLKKDNPV